MAYDAANLSLAETLRQGRWQKWIYESDDLPTAVMATGYFSDGRTRGMRRGDQIVHVKADTARSYTGDVTAISGDAATVVLRGVLPSNPPRNWLWQGAFASSRRSGSFSTQDKRRYTIDGWTAACTDGNTDAVILHCAGLHGGWGMYARRTLPSTSTAPLVSVANMSAKETMGLAGQDGFLSFFAKHGATYTGPQGRIGVDVWASLVGEQPITQLNGEYGDGAVLIASEAFDLSEEAQAATAPLSMQFAVPDRTIQLAVVVQQPFAGLSPGTDDSITVSNMGIGLGSTPYAFPFVGAADVRANAMDRFRSSRSPGMPEGAETVYGAASGIAISTATEWGIVIPVTIDPPMGGDPTVFIRSPLNPGENQMYDHTGGANVNARIYNVSPAGFVVTNSQALTVGRRYSFHWLAEWLL